ncbi:MAG: cytochrome c [Sulfuricaulis sp.]|nr:cytochrome c [Sulfuricaulis sp.]
MKQHITRTLIFTGMMLAALAPSGLSAAEPEDVIKYRKNMMQAIGGHTSAAGAIVQGKVDYTPHLAEHARALQVLTKDIPALFPKDSDFGDTEAMDVVWTKRADFEKAAKTAKIRVAAFAKAVQSGNPQAITASFKDMGEACKGCHKDFRKEEK